MYRVLRKIVVTILTVVVLVAILVGGLATPVGHGLVARLIERVGATQGLTVSVTGLDGWPPFWLGVETMTVADADGPFLLVNDLAVDVGLSGLLDGTVALDSLTARRVAVARAPDLPAGDGSGGGLVAFAAKRFAISELDLSEELVGRPATLVVEGSFASGADGTLALDLAARRIDGVAGTLHASLSRASAEAQFSAEIDLREAPDGILVGLMGRPSGPAYSLVAKMAPEGEALRGSVSLASDQTAQFNGGFALLPAGDAKRLEVSGRGDIAGLVPPDFADLLAGSIDISLDADWQAAEEGYLPELSIRQGRFSTENITAAASGTLSRTVADLSLTLDIADPSGAAIALPLLPEPAELQSAALRGTVAPSNGVIRLELTGNLSGLEIAGTAVPATGLSLAVETERGEAIVADTLPFALRVEADSIRTASGTIEGTDSAPLLLTAEGTVDTRSGTAETDATLRIAGGQADFRGTVSRDTTRGTLNADFSEIGPLAALFEQTVSGGVNGSAQGTFLGPDGADLAVNLGLTDIDTGDETVGRLLRGQTRLAGSVARSPQGVLSVSDLVLESDLVEATADGTIGSGTVDASLEGTIANLSALADRSEGSATFTAEISGAIERPSINAAVSVAEGSLIDQPISNGVVRFAGQPTDEGWSGALNLDGTFAGSPLAGEADVMASGDAERLSFPNIDLTIGENRITGEIERTSDGLFSGALDVAAPNLSSLAALALIEAAGTADARVALTPEGGRQAMTVSFSGSDISYQIVAAGSIEGEARIADVLGTPRVNGNAVLDAVDIGTVHLDRVSATAAVEGGATDFEMSARGADIDLSGSGTLAGEAGANVLRIDTVSGTAYRVPVALQTPVRVRLGGTRDGVTNARIAVGSGSIVVDGRFSPELDATVVAERIAASVANGFVPGLGAQGTVAGRATLTGSLGSPSISWQATWSGLATTQTRGAGLPPLQLAARGNASMTMTTVNGTLTGAGLSLAVTGNVPFSGSGLSLRVRGPVPLRFLALRSTRELGLSGTAELDLSVVGNARQPQITGATTIANATIVDVETAFGVTNASGRIAFSGQRATVERFSARLAQGGQLTANGSVNLAGAQLPADLRIRITNGRYNDGQVIDAAFGADLALNGPLLGNGTLSGTVALGRTQIQLPDSFGGGTTAIDVRHINAPPGFVAPQLSQSLEAGRSTGGGGLRVSIEMTNSGGIFVRGFGVDAEFGGSLRLTNTLADPVAVGGFEMRRGRLEIVGRRFNLTTGRLTFSGDLVPILEIAATTSTSDAVVTLHIDGPADDPTISFTSNPDLPQEEILSRLLFDRNVSRLSVVQAAQLVDAAAQFSGVTGGQSFFAQIRNAIGLDDLDIRQSASGGATVGIGKRINERVNLGVEAGTGAGGGRVTIDLDITQDLKASVSAGQGGTGSVGLSYEHEY